MSMIWTRIANGLSTEIGNSSIYTGTIGNFAILSDTTSNCYSSCSASRISTCQRSTFGSCCSKITTSTFNISRFTICFNCIKISTSGINAGSTSSVLFASFSCCAVSSKISWLYISASRIRNACGSFKIAVRPYVAGGSSCKCAACSGCSIHYFRASSTTSNPCAANKFFAICNCNIDMTWAFTTSNALWSCGRFIPNTWPYSIAWSLF